MDSRKFVRINSDFNVWYQTLDEDDMSFGKPLSKNISAGGIQLEMEEPETVGAYLLLKFNVPEYDNKINARGRIVWVKKGESGNYEVGIEFLEISRDDMAAINNLQDE